MMDTSEMTGAELQRAGLAVLVECLGDGIVRFMQQYDIETANDIASRYTWSDPAPIDTTAITDDELHQAGLDALSEHLGPGGMLRFLRHYIKGEGNYTEDRHQWLDKLAPGEFIAQARKVPRPE